MPIISGGGTGSGKISGVTISGVAAAGQVPVASSSSAGVWAVAPGAEIGYTQITANVNVVSTTEATGTTIISAGALTFDGTPVICEFFCDRIVMPSESVTTTPVTFIISLFEGATQITRLAQVVFEVNTTTNNALQVPIAARYRFTPSAGSHTYTITAAVSATTNTPNVQAGAGGTATDSPAFVRFTKV